MTGRKEQDKRKNMRGKEEEYKAELKEYKKETE